MPVDSVNNNIPSIRLINLVKEKNPNKTQEEVEKLAREIGDQDKDGDCDLRDAMKAPDELQEKIFGIRDLTFDPKKYVNMNSVDLHQELGVVAGVVDEAISEDKDITEASLEKSPDPDDPYWRAAGYLCEMLRRDGIIRDRAEVYKLLIKALEDGKISNAVLGLDGKGRREASKILGPDLGEIITGAACDDLGLGRCRTPEQLEARMRELNRIFRALKEVGYTLTYHLSRRKFIHVDLSLLDKPGSDLYNLVSAKNPAYEKIRTVFANELKTEIRDELKQNDLEGWKKLSENEQKERVNKETEKRINQFLGLHFIILAQKGLEDNGIRDARGLKLAHQDDVDKFFEQIVKPIVLHGRLTPEDPRKLKIDGGLKNIKPKEHAKTWLKHFKRLSKMDPKFMKWIERVKNKMTKKIGKDIMVKGYDKKGKEKLVKFNPERIDRHYVKKDTFVLDEAYELFKNGRFKEAWNLLLTIPQTIPVPTGSALDSKEDGTSDDKGVKDNKETPPAAAPGKKDEKEASKVPAAESDKSDTSAAK